MAILTRRLACAKIAAWRTIRRALPIIVTFLAGCWLGSASAIAADSSSLEDAVKATFVLKFIPFVSWPPSAPNTDTFNICTEGNDKVVGLFATSVQGQSADGRRISVRALTAGQPADDCRVVYIASDVAAAPVLEQLHAKPILTITQSSGSDHGIIQLLTLGHHVTFDIDLKLASDDGIVVSSKLLGLAHSVTQGGGGQ
jgi:YfiR/HmsC-like